MILYVSLSLEVRIVCSAEKEPAKLFLTAPLAEEERENNRLLMDDLGIDAVRDCILFTYFRCSDNSTISLLYY